VFTERGIIDCGVGSLDQRLRLIVGVSLGIYASIYISYHAGSLLELICAPHLIYT
jgi:hypothetical protein